MNRYLRALLYGILAFCVYSGVSFWFGGRVNWVLAAGTALGIMLGYCIFLRRFSGARSDEEERGDR